MTELNADNAVEEKRPRVVVVGSANTDMVVRVPNLPVPGETLLGSGFALVPGGKGPIRLLRRPGLGLSSPLSAVSVPTASAIHWC